MGIKTGFGETAMPSVIYVRDAAIFRCISRQNVGEGKWLRTGRV
jgi:hypothetical protein